jgi:aminopeptidase N
VVLNNGLVIVKLWSSFSSAYGIGTPEAFYTALRRAASEDVNFRIDYPNADIGDILDSWVQTAGSPVVNVAVNMTSGAITLRQVSNKTILLNNLKIGILMLNHIL